MATFALTYVNLGCSDPVRLGRFYARLLGWRLDSADPQTAVVENPAGGTGVSCQYEQHHEQPAWPAQPGDQQMQAHLEVRVDDLPGAVAYALECGATLAQFQPQDDVRVCLDPAGHPFCLYL